MARIIKSAGLTDKKAEYNIVNARGGKLSDHVGERINIKAFAYIERVNTDGAVTVSFICETIDGEYLGTNSRSFIDGLDTYLGIFGEGDLLTEGFEVEQAASKSGRHYITFKA